MPSNGFLISVFLIIKKVEHLFICLMPVSALSSMKCMFSCLPIFTVILSFQVDF